MLVFSSSHSQNLRMSGFPGLFIRQLADATDFLGCGSILYIQFILDFIIIISNLKVQKQALQWLNEVDLVGGKRAMN